MLLYFIESDFNLNDDYTYTYEDARQFYIRREILRSIASHTCSDIYNVKNTTFSSLLFVCDEMQEWGRKSWGDLYTNINPNSVSLSIEKFDSDLIKYSEVITMQNVSDKEIIIDNIIRLYSRQFESYQLIFRDGQYTNSRSFDLEKKIKIIAGSQGSQSNEITINFSLLAKRENKFVIDISESQLDEESIQEVFCKKLNVKELPISINIIGKNE